MFVNDPEGVLRFHHAENALLVTEAHRRHPMHRRSYTRENSLHHAARWVSVMAYHYASHARRALREAAHGAAVPVRAAH